MKEGLDSPAPVVSILGTRGHDGIEAGPPARIGALATLARIAADPALRAPYPALAEAAAGAATPQIRHMATLGGNLCQRPRCWYYRPADFDCRRRAAECFAREGENRFHAIFDTDLLAAASTPRRRLGAARLRRDARRRRPEGKAHAADRHLLRSADRRRHPREHPRARRYHRGVRSRRRQRGRARCTGSSRRRNLRLAARRACVNLTISGGAVREARVVLGSVAPTPHRSAAAEAVLGRRPRDDELASGPPKPPSRAPNRWPRTPTRSASPGWCSSGRCGRREPEQIRFR